MTEDEMERDKRNYLKWLNSPSEKERYRSPEWMKERSIERTKQKFEKALPSKKASNEPKMSWLELMAWLLLFAVSAIVLLKWFLKR